MHMYTSVGPGFSKVGFLEVDNGLNAIFAIFDDFSKWSESKDCETLKKIIKKGQTLRNAIFNFCLTHFSH